MNHTTIAAQEALRRSVLRDVDAERDRQEQLVADGKFAMTCADDAMTDLKRLPVLLEEVGEVANAMNEHDYEGLVDELTQVAAVAVAWLEALHRRKTTRWPA